MRNEQQIALAARRGDDLRGARVPGFGGQLPRPRQGAFRHRPAEKIVAGCIDGEDAYPAYSARLLHPFAQGGDAAVPERGGDRKSTRLNSSHGYISYAVFCLKKKKKQEKR